MTPCPTCACHGKLADLVCVHCGATRAGSTVRNTVAGALLGLTVACVGTTTKDSTTDTGGGATLYGVTFTDTTPTDAGDADADLDTDVDADIDTDVTTTTTTTPTSTGDTGDTGSTSTSAPLYGVPPTATN